MSIPPMSELMLGKRSMRASTVQWFIVCLCLAAVLAQPANALGTVFGQATGAVRIGRVLTAASVRGWGDYVARDQFLPGELVWLYAETLGTARNARVVMISISVDSDAAAWRSAMAAEKMPWHQHLDSSGRIARLFGVRPIPTTLVIDGEGVVRKRIVGYSSSLSATLDDAIRKALKKEPPR